MFFRFWGVGDGWFFECFKGMVGYLKWVKGCEVVGGFFCLECGVMVEFWMGFFEIEME